MKLNKSLIIGLAAGASLVLSGCASTNAEKGAAIGALTGAILGKSTANHKDKRAVWGAAIGAIAGAAIGDYMDKQEAAFRSELAGSGVEVVREGDNLRLVMPSNVTFATGQSYISGGFHDTLDAVANVLNRYEKTYLSIVGHTDDVGSAQFNQKLSEERADSVKSYLSQRQINPLRLETRGYGEGKPLVPNNSDSNRALNRRVEIQIVPNRV